MKPCVGCGEAVWSDGYERFCEACGFTEFDCKCGPDHLPLEHQSREHAERYLRTHGPYNPKAISDTELEAERIAALCDDCGKRKCICVTFVPKYWES